MTLKYISHAEQNSIDRNGINQASNNRCPETIERKNEIAISVNHQMNFLPRILKMCPSIGHVLSCVLRMYVYTICTHYVHTWVCVCVRCVRMIVLHWMCGKNVLNGSEHQIRAWHRSLKKNPVSMASYRMRDFSHCYIIIWKIINVICMVFAMHNMIILIKSIEFSLL